MKVKSEREVAQSCPTLSDSMDYSPRDHEEQDTTEQLTLSLSFGHEGRDLIGLEPFKNEMPESLLSLPLLLMRT